ncbi:MAG TPA: beta-galactosidase [Anaerolineae bacterium]|nr:beta-galactosidase [Anaerolineae bacterium]HQI86354.1 beta-galactosidase [Anaerolineae bacterium]
MSTFRAAEGLFWIDDRPILLQAGEFHYFRTPADQWPHRLGLLKAAGFNAVASYIPWLWHQPSPDAPDFDGRTHPLRNLAGFLDLAHALGLYVIARSGPYIMAETINEGIPPWVFERYPQAAFVDQHGQAQNLASYLHPDFRRCATAWYEAVFSVLAPRQITRGGPIVLVQLDNEMGMMQWVRNIFDLNPDTLTRFAAYLHQTCGDALHEPYPFDVLPEALCEQLTLPHTPFATRLVADYRRFYRRYLRDYAAFLLDTARAYGLEVPPVINIHGFGNGGKTFPIGLSQLVEVMALDGVISATDVYPLFIGESNIHHILLVNAMTAALQNPQQPLFSIEFQAGGNQDFGNGQTSLYDLHTRLSLACGMRAFNHYLFCDGENDPLLSPVKRHDWGHPVRKDGTVRRHYHRYPRLSRVLAAYGDALTRARPETVTTIGFRLDDFMTEVNLPATQAATDILTHQREVILFDFIARGLTLTHRPFAALDLCRAALDVPHHPWLWVMLDQTCEAAIQRKLVDYVASGGKLVIVGRLPREDENGQLCTLLRDALGVTAVNSDPSFTSRLITAFDHSDVPVSFVETYAGNFDAVWATCEGAPVGITQRLGQGTVMLLGAALAANTLDDLDIVDQIALRMGCVPLFTLSDWADVYLSRGERGSFLFINNYQDDPIETTVAYRGDLLFSGHPLRLPARQGLILPLEWQLRPDITLHYATAEVTGISADATGLTITLSQDTFWAELTAPGYRVQAIPALFDEGERCTVCGMEGAIRLVATR